MCSLVIIIFVSKFILELIHSLHVEIHVLLRNVFTSINWNGFVVFNFLPYVVPALLEFAFQFSNAPKYGLV